MKNFPAGKGGSLSSLESYMAASEDAPRDLMLRGVPLSPCWGWTSRQSPACLRGRQSTWGTREGKPRSSGMGTPGGPPQRSPLRLLQESDLTEDSQRSKNIASESRPQEGSYVGRISTGGC